MISHLFDDFVELSGDGRVGRDVCIRGGLASFAGRACMVMGTFKGICFFYYFDEMFFVSLFLTSKTFSLMSLSKYLGHGPQAMQEANYGMASPHGYRTAMRLMQVNHNLAAI